MANFIRNPINAFGLLLDNCLNMNATNVSINLFKYSSTNGIQMTTNNYNLIEIKDNSLGFNQN